MHPTATTAMDAISQRVRGAFDAVELKAWRGARGLICYCRTFTNTLNHAIQGALRATEAHLAKRQERDRVVPNTRKPPRQATSDVDNAVSARNAA